MMCMSVKSSSASVLVGDDVLSTLDMTTRVMGSTLEVMSNRQACGGTSTTSQWSLNTACESSSSGSQAPPSSLVWTGSPRVPAVVTSQNTPPVPPPAA